MSNSKTFNCPYNDIICDKFNQVTRKPVCSCSECNHFNGGVRYTKKISRLTIGVITPDIHYFRQFKENNKDHKVYVINNADAFHSLAFDFIVCGHNWELVSDEIVQKAYRNYNSLPYVKR